MDTAPTPLRSLRRFVATAFATSPRTSIEALVVTLVLSATEGIGLLLLVPLLQLVGVDAQQGALTRIAGTLAAAFQFVGLRPTLGPVLGAYVVIVGLQAMLQRRQVLLNVAVQQQIVTTLRNRLYRAIAGAKWIAFARTRSSDHAQLLTDEVSRVGTASYYLVDVFVMATTSLVYVVIAFRVSPAMTSFVLICAAALAATMRGKMRSARAIGEDLSAAWTRLYAAIAEHFAGLKLAKSHGAERGHAETFARLSQKLDNVGRASAVSQSGLQQQLALGSAVVLATIVYVSYAVLRVSTAQLLLLLFLFARLMPRVTGLYARAQALAMALPAFTAVTAAEERYLAAAEPVVEQQLDIALTEQVEFRHVSFAYDAGNQSPAVRDVTLTLAAGATTAIVGPSGAGKSTLADLLMGLLTPTRGGIFIDGTPLTVDRLDAWRSQIGYVAQETFLFHDSVRANLLWAKPEASEEEIWRALRMASADAFVSELVRGLDTVVGERGVLLSGGERQRIALARALLRRPALLILDEATSALDADNESRIRQAIDNLHQQMTIVIITHRLATIRGADVIHVVEGGRLAESGTWTALMANGAGAGRFREWCDAQGVGERSAAGAEALARGRAGTRERRFEVVGR